MNRDHLADLLMPGIRGKINQLNDLAQYLENIPAVIRNYSGWQPIETAPKDDTEILLVCLLYFSDDTSDRMITSGLKCFTHPHDEPNMYWVNGITLPATHWMPLPKLPEEIK